MAQRSSRLAREIQQLTTAPPAGISCWPIPNEALLTNETSEEKKEMMEGKTTEATAATAGAVEQLKACIVGSSGTAYEGGEFYVEIGIPAKYPFEPPKVRFITPIYHPNIDTVGRICMDLLKMPPAVSVTPSFLFVSFLPLFVVWLFSCYSLPMKVSISPRLLLKVILNAPLCHFFRDLGSHP